MSFFTELQVRHTDFDELDLPSQKNKILEIYYTNETYFDVGSKKDLNFKTILKNKNEIFDSKILID